MGAAFGGTTYTTAEDRGPEGEAGALGNGATSGGESTNSGGAPGPSSGGTISIGGAIASGASTSGGAGSSGSSGGGGSASSLDDGLVINELYAEGSDAFVELFNTSNAPLTLDGYYLAHGADTPDASSRIDLSGVLAVGAYYVVSEGLPSELNAEGSTLWLVDDSGHIVDSVTYPGSSGSNGLGGSDSFARLPNGFGDFGRGDPTQGSVNQPH